MFKKLLGIIMIACIVSCTCSCALLNKPLDKRMGFSKQLEQLESNIRSEKWEDAKKDADASKRTWKKIKPILQVDIDHDYVNDIEENFVKLDGYIDTKEKASSLAVILLVEDTWKNIGKL